MCAPTAQHRPRPIQPANAPCQRGEQQTLRRLLCLQQLLCASSAAVAAAKLTAALDSCHFKPAALPVHLACQLPPEHMRMAAAHCLAGTIMRSQQVGRDQVADRLLVTVEEICGPALVDVWPTAV